MVKLQDIELFELLDLAEGRYKNAEKIDSDFSTYIVKRLLKAIVRLSFTTIADAKISQEAKQELSKFQLVLEELALKNQLKKMEKDL